MILNFIRELFGLPPKHIHEWELSWRDEQNPLIQFQRCLTCKLKRSIYTLTRHKPQ